MRYFVYLLISGTNDKSVTYVGYTSNIKNRVTLHNTSKGAKFTKGRQWKLIYKKAYNTKSSAMRNEYLLKKNIKKRSIIKKKFFKNI